MSNQERIVLFYSKTQLKTIKQIEGKNFIPRVAVINGVSKEYTERRRDTSSSYADAELLYDGPINGVKIL